MPFVKYLRDTGTAKVAKLQRLWERHNEILRLWSTGLFTEVEVAHLVGVTSTTAQQVINSELGQEYLTRLSRAKDYDTVQLTKRVEELADIGLVIQRNLLIDEKTSASVKNDIAKTAQDRVLGKPVQRALVGHINAGLSREELEEIKERAESLKKESVEDVDFEFMED